MATALTRSVVVVVVVVAIVGITGTVLSLNAASHFCKCFISKSLKVSLRSLLEFAGSMPHDNRKYAKRLKGNPESIGLCSYTVASLYSYEILEQSDRRIDFDYDTVTVR